MKLFNLFGRVATNKEKTMRTSTNFGLAAVFAAGLALVAPTTASAQSPCFIPGTICQGGAFSATLQAGGLATSLAEVLNGAEVPNSGYAFYDGNTEQLLQLHADSNGGGLSLNVTDYQFGGSGITAASNGTGLVGVVGSSATASNVIFQLLPNLPPAPPTQ